MKIQRGPWNENRFHVLEGFPDPAHLDEVGPCSGALAMLNPPMNGWNIYAQLRETPGAISSLNEAWFHTLDRCVVDTPLSEAIFPLMRDCSFGGAMHAVLLLQSGHGDQLGSDIAAFIMKEPQS